MGNNELEGVFFCILVTHLLAALDILHIIEFNRAFVIVTNFLVISSLRLAHMNQN